MGDEMLKWLITDAKLFEAQIRYGINGPLGTIEVEVLSLRYEQAYDPPVGLHSASKPGQRANCDIHGPHITNYLSF